MRIPIPSGSRIAVLNVPDDTVVLRPALPREAIVDVGAAVRDAQAGRVDGIAVAVVIIARTDSIAVTRPRLGSWAVQRNERIC